MHPMTPMRSLPYLLLCIALSACGLKGPLYLPERSEPVGVDTAPASDNANSTAEPAGDNSDEQAKKQAQ